MRFFIEADFLHNSLVQFLYIKVFWRKMQIWCCSVRIQKGKKKRKKKFKTVLGNLEGKFSVLPSHEAKEKKFFPSDWVSKRMTGLNIDIVKILLLWNVLSVYKNVFESSQGGTFKLANPNESKELSINLVDSLSLNFLDCRAEMCIHLYEEFLCQYEFQLSLSFSRQNKELETKSKRFVCFNFSFNIKAQIV